MNKMKRMFAGVLALVMIMAGAIVAPTQADAAADIKDKIIYEKMDHASHWNADNPTAPIKEGYVFGGWFRAADAEAEGAELEAGTTNYYAPYTKDEMSQVSAGTAYAKFVPAQVLSVKAQNEAGTNANTTKANVRVMTSVDSRNYDFVGFDIWLVNKNKLYKDNDYTAKLPLQTTKVYDGIMAGGKEMLAEDIFGNLSDYVAVWKLGNIAKEHFAKIIYVRPYWITMDGTKVEGLAKYVHVEDQYNGYVSVPVNLLGGESVAAGVLNLVSSTSGLALAGDSEDIAFEAGRLMPEMAFNYDSKSNTVKMAGNVSTQGNASSKESLYANIRFKKSSFSATTNFTVTPISFADWDADTVDTLKVWDVQYVVK